MNNVIDHENNISNSNHEDCNTNSDKSLLSSFLPRLLEDYKEKYKPTTPNSPSPDRSQSSRRSQESLNSPPSGPFLDSNINERIRNDNRTSPSHQEKISGRVAVVSDNARIPSSRLLWSASQHSKHSLRSIDYDGEYHDRRENNTSEHDDEYDGFGGSIQIHPESVDGKDHNGDEEDNEDELSFLSIPRRSNSYVLGRSELSFSSFMPILPRSRSLRSFGACDTIATRNKIEKKQDHRSHRWSPDGSSISTIQKDTTLYPYQRSPYGSSRSTIQPDTALRFLHHSTSTCNVNDLPKQYARRPSI